MNQCPKCGREVDKDMVICPFCGEQFYNPNTKSRELVNIHLARYLVLTSILLPFVGLIVSFCFRKTYPVFSKVLARNAIYGFIIWLMVILLVLICYLALFSMGVAYM